MFLVGWAIYLTLVIDVDTSIKYAACATIEAIIAYILNCKYRVVAWLGYSLIFINAYGLLLFKLGYSPFSYDLAYAVISIAQILFLLARAMPNGIHRLPFKRFMVRAVSLDSCGAYDRMYKNKKSKGPHK